MGVYHSDYPKTKYGLRDRMRYRGTFIYKVPDMIPIELPFDFTICRSVRSVLSVFEHCPSIPRFSFGWETEVHLDICSPREPIPSGIMHFTSLDELEHHLTANLIFDITLQYSNLYAKARKHGIA